MKILYITTIGNTMNFFIDLINQLVCDGHKVDIACNAESKLAKEYSKLGCSVFHLDCSRSPLSKGNLSCVGQIRKIVEDNRYDIVHCHTPIAAACTRVACRNLRKKGLRVFYTAHGFHFYKGAPLKNWLIYYPIEWLLSWYTDVLIVINREDYKRAKKFKTGKVVYIPGVGIHTEEIKNTFIEREELRLELGFSNSDFIFMSTGEISVRKNHEIVIRALKRIKNKNIKYLIVGCGKLENKLKNLTQKLGLEDRIVFAGYRSDIKELLHAVDAFVFPSLQEGLPVALMEAMAAGLPIIASRIRGNIDLIEDGVGGYLVDRRDITGFVNAMEKTIKNDDKDVGYINQKLIRKFDCNLVNAKMRNLYDVYYT